MTLEERFANIQKRADDLLTKSNDCHDDKGQFCETGGGGGSSGGGSSSGEEGTKVDPNTALYMAAGAKSGWEQQKERGTYKQTLGGVPVELSFRKGVYYHKEGMLRIPAKTKTTFSVTLNAGGHQRELKAISYRGEGQHEKETDVTNKIIALAEKQFGIKLGQYDLGRG